MADQRRLQTKWRGRFLDKLQNGLLRIHYAAYYRDILAANGGTLPDLGQVVPIVILKGSEFVEFKFLRARNKHFEKQQSPVLEELPFGIQIVGLLLNEFAKEPELIAHTDSDLM